jgi:hypothetical protein
MSLRVIRFVAVLLTAYTTDLNADRLNIEVGRAGVVTGLRCG